MHLFASGRRSKARKKMRSISNPRTGNCPAPNRPERRVKKRVRKRWAIVNEPALLSSLASFGSLTCHTLAHFSYWPPRPRHRRFVPETANNPAERPIEVLSGRGYAALATAHAIAEVWEFLSECAVRRRGRHVQVSELYRVYVARARAKSLPQLTKNSLARTLKRCGLTSLKSNVHYWVDLELIKRQEDFQSEMSLTPSRVQHETTS
jgi:hypothetical protein